LKYLVKLLHGTEKQRTSVLFSDIKNN